MNSSKITNQLKKDIVEILKNNLTPQYIPEERQAAPDVYMVWRGELANYQLWEIASSITDKIEALAEERLLRALLRELREEK